MPEAGDNYLNAEIMLPQASKMKRGQVTRWKRDSDGNPLGHAHPNLLFDTWSYTVEFDNGEVTTLTTNLIAESMYLQCDPDGNQYVLLEDIIDHRKCGTVIPFSD